MNLRIIKENNAANLDSRVNFESVRVKDKIINTIDCRLSMRRKTLRVS